MSDMTLAEFADFLDRNREFQITNDCAVAISIGAYRRMAATARAADELFGRCHDAIRDSTPIGLRKDHPLLADIRRIRGQK